MNSDTDFRDELLFCRKGVKQCRAFDYFDSFYYNDEERMLNGLVIGINNSAFWIQITHHIISLNRSKY